MRGRIYEPEIYRKPENEGPTLLRTQISTKARAQTKAKPTLQRFIEFHRDSSRLSSMNLGSKMANASAKRRVSSMKLAKVSSSFIALSFGGNQIRTRVGLIFWHGLAENNPKARVKHRLAALYSKTSYEQGRGGRRPRRSPHPTGYLLLCLH